MALQDGDPPFRMLPRLTSLNRHFWQGGERGELVFLRCGDCGYYLHPPLPMCPRDRSKRITAQAVSGRAVVASFSVNYQQWLPGLAVPYVVALVEIVEQPELRLTTNIVGCDPEAVSIGLEVAVCFEHHTDPQGDVWLPLFSPIGAAV